jgi:hypothetical protein
MKTVYDTNNQIVMVFDPDKSTPFYSLAWLYLNDNRQLTRLYSATIADNLNDLYNQLPFIKNGNCLSLGDYCTRL